jgi:hypothetical protein
LKVLVASNWTVGLRKNECDLMAGGDDGFECGDGELRGSAEDKSHSSLS